MKQLIDITLITLSLVFIVGCATKAELNPSQNTVLNSVSASNAGKKSPYFMQSQLDHFLSYEWFPTISHNSDIQKKYMDKKVDAKTGKVTYVDRESDDFTLQETFDKVNAYMDDKPQDYNNSNVKRMESLPVIGK